jgi:hypothetical protein
VCSRPGPSAVFLVPGAKPSALPASISHASHWLSIPLLGHYPPPSHPDVCLTMGMRCPQGLNTMGNLWHSPFKVRHATPVSCAFHQTVATMILDTIAVFVIFLVAMLMPWLSNGAQSKSLEYQCSAKR